MDGTLAAPVEAAGGQTLAGNGIGTYGNSYVADWDGIPAHFGLDNIINWATGPGGGHPRGLLWNTPKNLNATPGLDRSQLFDPCSKSITDAINGMCAAGGLTWEITRRGHMLRLFKMPVPPLHPTRLLIAPDPPGRTLAGYYNRLYLRYQVTADGNGGTATYANAHVENPASARRFGELEGYGDWSQAGVADEPKALGWARGVLAAYQSASYTTAFAVDPRAGPDIGRDPGRPGHRTGRGGLPGPLRRRRVRRGARANPAGHVPGR